ncbi:MAG: UDP-3-O-(3-hydroxymyristoyl)glucosamine N-acyltransferase [Pseudomonadota bacterium]
MSIALGELALELGCELDGDPAATVDTVATLAAAGPGSLSFLANPSYERFLDATRATAVVVAPELAGRCPTNTLIHTQPYRAYALAAARLHPPAPPAPGIHASAVIAPSARIAASAEIAAGVVVGADSQVGEGVVVGPNTVLGAMVVIGDHGRIAANVTVYDDVRIGRRCRIHSAAVIGADGFGFAPGDDGWLTVPQVGGVRIGDDVDIGAGTCIDRGAIDHTVIGNGVKLDNLCQIAHNVTIGDHTALAAQCGIAGSATIGSRCLFAGHSGTVGHVSVCDGVVVSGKCMVTKDIDKPGQYGAALPAMPMREYRRAVARIRQLDKMAARLTALERREDENR